jgi:hypothetical protein
MVAKLRKSLLLAMAVGNKSKVVRLEGSVRLEVSRESKFEWAYGLKLARIGQVSILEQKARVSAARFFPMPRLPQTRWPHPTRRQSELPRRYTGHR